MSVRRVALLVLAVLAVAGPASAASIDKGASLLAIQLSRGVADLTGDAGGFLLPFSKAEAGVQGQYWYFLADGYGANVSAGIGYYKESDTADPSDPFASDFKQTVTSWQVRVGGDRFAQLGDKLQVFAGPGIQFWGGKLKAEDLSGEAESPSTTRIALTGRIGAHIVVGQNFGIIGHVGQYWGYATAEDGAMKTKWLPSGSEGAMGFSFGF
jgi:hypothetical protein